MAAHSPSRIVIRSSLLVLAPLVLGVFSFTGCASSDGLPAPAKTANEGLTITLADSNHVAGRFTEHGVGVSFDSSKDASGAHLKLENLAGATLFELTDDPTAKQQTIEFGAQRLRQTISYQLMSGPAPTTMPAASDLSTQGDIAAAGELGRSPEYALLPDLSRALGSLGFDANSHPGALPIHLAAITAQKAIDRGMTAAATSAANPSVTPAAPGERVTGLQPVGICTFITCWNGQKACLGGCPVNPNQPPPAPPPLVCPDANGMDLRSDPCHNDCFGMCGNDCNCWSWVCGNCSYNDSCADHDSWCASCSSGAFWDCGLCYSPAAVWAFSCRLD